MSSSDSSSISSSSRESSPDTLSVPVKSLKALQKAAANAEAKLDSQLAIRTASSSSSSSSTSSSSLQYFDMGVAAPSVMADPKIDSQLALEVASSPHPDNSIYRLSGAPEGQSEIVKFELRSTRDVKALALVSHEWRDIVLPMLWNTLTTDLVPTKTKELVDLVRPHSNILKHVQYLCLQKPAEKEAEDENDAPLPGRDLPLLLCVIPKNQLRGFESDISLPYLTFQILLQLHQRMHTLRVVTDGHDAHHLLTQMAQSPWALKCFSNLKHLTVYPAQEDARGTRLLLDQSPQLETLELKHRGDNPPTSISTATFDEKEDESRVSLLRKWAGWAEVQNDRYVALQKLAVHQVHLPKLLDGFFRRINVLLLKELVLVETPTALYFLRQLAQKFKGGKPELKKFTLAEMDAESCPTFNQDTSLFLNSFIGLVELRINGVQQSPLDVKAVVHHGASLRILSLVTDDSFDLDAKHCYTAPQFAQLTTGCPKLEQLRINIYELCARDNIDVDMPDTTIFRPSPPVQIDQAPQEFRQVLSSIASLRNLHTLHFAQHPLLVNCAASLEANFWMVADGWASMHMQAQATSLLQNLTERGSKVKVLGFGPIAGDMPSLDNIAPDTNGHIFPKYFYYKARMRDGMGVDVVIARPLREREKEFPGSTVLAGI
ncbi:hypothetical protein BDV96DRAFT_677639 [Lophiotrema nucula]|uniref:Uncharacterized protein n=1 Tax=Lophiotrema nucula TaxID=690887 RepID=A0A6A5ZIY6_9PLEO|nr:hypothetical protein BDV96DRAFT_677639 [Lophiotrema nucula]